MYQANAGKSLWAAVPCHFLRYSDEQEAKPERNSVNKEVCWKEHSVQHNYLLWRPALYPWKRRARDPQSHSDLQQELTWLKLKLGNERKFTSPMTVFARLILEWPKIHQNLSLWNIWGNGGTVQPSGKKKFRWEVIQSNTPSRRQENSIQTCFLIYPWLKKKWVYILSNI